MHKRAKLEVKNGRVSQVWVRSFQIKSFWIKKKSDHFGFGLSQVQVKGELGDLEFFILGRLNLSSNKFDFGSFRIGSIWIRISSHYKNIMI